MADAVSDLDNQPAYESSVRLAQSGIVLKQVFSQPSVAYRAAIWQRGKAKAFVVRGTFVPGTQGQNLIQDYEMKRLSKAPIDLVRAAVGDINRHMSPPHGYNMFVGSSLGGSTAQLLGFLYGLPFMTFNAPGMRYDVMRRISVRVAGTLGDNIAASATKGWSEMISVLTMLKPGRKVVDDHVAATPWLDQSYDQARVEIARNAGIPVPDSTANVTPEKQLGFNIAHSRDSIHNSTGVPIGRPYQFADWSEAASGTSGPSPHLPWNITYYHDSKKMAEFLFKQPWAQQRPIRPYIGPLGKTYYFGPAGT